MLIKSNANFGDRLGNKVTNVLKANNLGIFGEVKIVLISGVKDPNYAIWKEMVEERHYLHSAKLFGQQVKYLIESSNYGWVGALSFGSASWRLKSRDDRIGWDDEIRKKELNKIVCNNRFLILPEFGVKNFASFILSVCLKRLPDDWEKVYGTRPILVETFVDSERFSGTCYKASNWTFLGETQGRGRNDRYHENSVSKKYIFAYEFKKGILKPAPQKTEADDWVTEEFKYAKLPNKAKKDRMVSIVRDFFGKPASPIPLCCEGQAKQKGAYRFFSDARVEPEDILSSHIKQTIGRAGEHKTVLSINDTTSFNLLNHKSTKGLGCLANSQNELGYLLHDTVIFTTDGVPLGVLEAQTWTRDVKEYGKKHNRKNKPIEEKESNKWLKSLKATSEAQQKAPEVMFVSVGDREADVYELFELAEQLKCNFLVRSSQNRKTAKNIKTWDLVEKEKPSGIMKVSVCGKDKKEREVELEIRFLKVIIPVPQNKKKKGEVILWAISAKEANTPKGEKVLHWKLFTNIKVENFDQACEKVEWYSIRFSIETFHRILKSGRRSEDKRLRTLDRLQRCLSIDMITAWRVMYLTMSGRKTPEVKSDFFFNENEIDVLSRIKYGNDYTSDKSLSLKEAVMVIAVLGGFVIGKQRVPGVEVMWRGLRRLEDIALGASLVNRCFSGENLMSSNFDYG